MGNFDIGENYVIFKDTNPLGSSGETMTFSRTLIHLAQDTPDRRPGHFLLEEQEGL